MIKGHGAPDTNVFASVGSKYFDLDTNTLYECTSVTDEPIDHGFVDVYTRTGNAVCMWKKLGEQNINIAEGLTSMTFKPAEFAAYVTEIVIPEGVTSLGSAGDDGDGDYYFGASHFPNLKRITIPASMGDFVSAPMGLGYDNSTIEEVVFSEGITHIGHSTFENFSALKKVVLPSTFTGMNSNSEIVDFYHAFTDKPVTVVVNAPKDSIPGAPWGIGYWSSADSCEHDATVIWTG